MIKERLYYWGTVVPLTAMLLYMYSEYRDQQDIIDRQYKTSNRQLQVMGANHIKILNEQSKRHNEELVKVIQHHREEVNEVLHHSQIMIEEAKKK